MANIKVYDLYPDDDDGKFVHELNAWETKTVYAGYGFLDNGYSRTGATSTQPEEADTPAVDRARANLAQWMDSLEVQIKDLRKQLGISQ